MGKYYTKEGERVEEGTEGAEEKEWYEYAGVGDWDSSFGGAQTQYPKFQTEELGTREQKDLRAQYFQMLMGMKDPQGYTGQYTAPLSEYEGTGLEALKRYLGQAEPGHYGDIETALTQLLSGESPYEVDPEATTQYLQDYLRPQMARTYGDIRTDLRESFAGGGRFWATPRLEAETGLGKDYLQRMTEEEAKYRYADIEAERAGKVKGAELQAGVMPQATAISDLLSGWDLRKTAASQEYGALPRLLEQNTLTQMYEEFKRKEDMKMKQAGLMQSALGLETTQPYMTAERPGWLAGMADVAGPIIGALIGKGG